MTAVDSGSGLQRRQCWLLALLFVLTTCTTMRLPGLPVGAGEVGLVLAGLGSLFTLRERLLPAMRQYRALLALWVGYLVLLLLAGLRSQAEGRLSLGWVHDVAAFSFAIAAAFLVLIQAGGSRQGVETLARAFAHLALGLSCFAFLLIIADYCSQSDFFSALFNANFWWYGRFSAWANDPNQWGLLLLVAGMLMVLLPGRLSLVLLAVLFWLLMEIRSDATIAGMLAFVVTYATLVAWRQPALRRRGVVVMLLFVACFGVFRELSPALPPSPVVRALGAIAGVEPTTGMLRKGKEMDSNGKSAFVGARENKLAERMSIWRHSIDAWRKSPAIGLGPGAYSGIDGPFQNTESHNLLVQILVNTGIAGLLLASGFLAWLLRGLWQSPEAAPWIAGMIGLLVQGLGQYLMRHPVFWLFIVIAVWQVVHARSGEAVMNAAGVEA